MKKYLKLYLLLVLLATFTINLNTESKAALIDNIENYIIQVENNLENNRITINNAEAFNRLKYYYEDTTYWNFIKNEITNNDNINNSTNIFISQYNTGITFYYNNYTTPTYTFNGSNWSVNGNGSTINHSYMSFDINSNGIIKVTKNSLNGTTMYNNGNKLIMFKNYNALNLTNELAKNTWIGQNKYSYITNGTKNVVINSTQPYVYWRHL